MAEQRLLFVCLGNICRSPAAEGVFLHLIAREGLEDRFLLGIIQQPVKFTCILANADSFLILCLQCRRHHRLQRCNISANISLRKPLR